MTTLKLFYLGKEKHICRENSFVLLQQNWKERSTTKIKPYVEVTRSLTSHIYSRCRFSTFNKNIFSETWTFQRSSVVFLQHWVLCGEEKWGDGKVFTHPCAPAENRKGRDSNHSNFDSYWFFKRKGMYGGCRSWQRLYASCSTLNLTSWRVFPTHSASQLTLLGRNWSVGQFFGSWRFSITLKYCELTRLISGILFLALTLGCWAITCQSHLNVDF